MTENENPSIEELEKLKLKAELKELNRPFFQKHVQVFSGLFIAVVSILAGLYTGFFDLQKVQMDITKKELSLDIKKFEQKKKVLNDSIKHMSKVKDSLELGYNKIVKSYQHQNHIVDSLKAHSKAVLTKHINSLSLSKKIKQDFQEYLKNSVSKTEFSIHDSIWKSIFDMQDKQVDELINLVATYEKYAATYKLWYEYRIEDMRVVGQTDPEFILFSVADQFGEPLRDAIIEVKGLEGFSFDQSIRSDKKGFGKILLIDPKTNKKTMQFRPTLVKIYKKGYHTAVDVVVSGVAVHVRLAKDDGTIVKPTTEVIDYIYDIPIN